MLIDPRSATGWLIVQGFLFVALSMLLALPHELGHAVAARCLGQDTSTVTVTVGVGPPVFRGRLFGIDLLLRLFPLGGVTTGERDARRLRSVRRYFVTLAGPGATLLLGSAVFVGAFAREPLPIVSLDSANLLAIFVLANVYVAMEALVPAWERVSGRTLGSDGMVIAQALFGRDARRRVPEARVASAGNESFVWIAQPVGAFAGSLLVIRLLRLLVGGPVRRSHPRTWRCGRSCGWRPWP